MIEIKSWLGAVLYRSETDTIKAALEEAVKSGPYLSGAKNLDAAILETGETFGVYLKEVVPALCIAGGKTLEEVVAAWECHAWENCPMAVAFGVKRPEDVPRLYRARVDQFVRLFDGGLIPCPVDLGGATSCEAIVKEGA